VPSDGDQLVERLSEKLPALQAPGLFRRIIQLGNSALEVDDKCRLRLQENG
jgi:hypothetical protein